MAPTEIWIFTSSETKRRPVLQPSSGSDVSRSGGLFPRSKSRIFDLLLENGLEEYHNPIIKESIRKNMKTKAKDQMVACKLEVDEKVKGSREMNEIPNYQNYHNNTIKKYLKENEE